MSPRAPLQKEYYGLERLRVLPGKDDFARCGFGSAICGMVTAVDEEVMGVTRLFVGCCRMKCEQRVDALSTTGVLSHFFP